ncbi:MULTISPECIES: hypothetical protein [unclassified Streptomyces]|uniref:hypothetical protein n=1 Tax=unclassified Streptomyces TaxID=2593676 RepID=UPI002DDAF742|nr:MULTISPECIES: hypothetical protein [unclassified Streptomyces]WSA93935.1 hypothetical protein OIE63_21875 [Streptomyces sp. NBC_01795]WSS13436.1 hypothetical protein OG533_17235 [Streptomyces sp. NBC_01186]WSS42225.1 hypothetical protein OG220_17795 [Streptomyces sp. NBC_01187]
MFVLVATSGAVWWLNRGEEGPYAGRPRVTDHEAGLSYAIPEGWKTAKGDLIDAFTSSISVRDKAADAGGMVAAGRAGAVPRSALQRQAEAAARSNAEFFSPDGKTHLLESQSTTVDGRSAYTVALKTKSEDGSIGHLRLTLIKVSGTRSAFVLGVADKWGARGSRTVDDVVRSTTLE